MTVVEQSPTLSTTRAQAVAERWATTSHGSLRSCAREDDATFTCDVKADAGGTACVTGLRVYLERGAVKTKVDEVCR